MTPKSKLAAGLLSLSLAGAMFIQQHEGTRYRAYLDPVGIPTICSGSTSGVILGTTETPAGCAKRLQIDTGAAGEAIQRCVRATLTQGQYDALASLAFNVGGGNLCRSTLLRKLNAGDCHGAANEFQRWNRAGGRVLPGLTTRRLAEADAFRRDC